MAQYSLIISAAVAVTGMNVVCANAQDSPLIPRQVLFGNPTMSDARISPDGRRISYLAPVDGVMNI